MHQGTTTDTATELESASGPLQQCAVAAHGQVGTHDQADGQQMQNRLQICLDRDSAMATRPPQQKQKQQQPQQQTQQPPQQTQQPPLHPQQPPQHPQQLAAAAVATATPQQLRQQEPQGKGTRCLLPRAHAAQTKNPVFAGLSATREQETVQTTGLSLT